MSANTRLPVAIHILAFAAIYPGQYPSECIAESANTNSQSGSDSQAERAAKKGS